MYAIGQVLYVVLAKKSQVYPMQVVEVITKKTLQGEEVRYVLRAGSDPKSTVFLDQIDGEIFDSVERTKHTLVQRATRQVVKLIDTAAVKSKEWYGGGDTAPPDVLSDLPLDDESLDEVPTPPAATPESGDMSVMLPDGTVAKVKLPTSI